MILKIEYLRYFMDDKQEIIDQITNMYMMRPFLLGPDIDFRKNLLMHGYIIDDRHQSLRDYPAATLHQFYSDCNNRDIIIKKYNLDRTRIEQELLTLIINYIPERYNIYENYVRGMNIQNNNEHLTDFLDALSADTHQLENVTEQDKSLFVKLIVDLSANVIDLTRSLNWADK